MANKKLKTNSTSSKYLSGGVGDPIKKILRKQARVTKRAQKKFERNSKKEARQGVRKFQAAGNPYAMPTSAATSGYTSTMSGMAGAEQAKQQLAQLQQEAAAGQQQQLDAAQESQRVKDAQFKQGVKTGVTDIADDFGRKGLQNAVQASRMAKIAKGTATAKQIAQASKGTGEVAAPLLNNLANYGSAAKTGTDVASTGASIGAGPFAAAAALAGKGVEHLSDDKDDTKTNFGEGAGRFIAGAGTGVSLATLLASGTALGGPIGLIGAGLVGGGMALVNQRKKKLAAREEEKKRLQEEEQIGASEQRAFEQSMVSTGQDQGYNIGNSQTNSYLPGYQMKGGGLWANIHAKRKRIAEGSGESMRKPGAKGAPTAENLKNSKQAGGSYMKPLAGGAVEFMGPKHSKGGIMLDAQTEVEGGETMDKVNMKNGGPGDYIFSDFLKVGKKTFAQRHKEMLERGGTQADIQKLAKMQEEVAKREGRDENGERNPKMIMEEGGATNYDFFDDDSYGAIPADAAGEDFELDAENAYARRFPEEQHKTEEGLYRRDDGDEVTMAEVEDLKASNPWYDWENFDPTDPESVMKFQEAYNAHAPEASKIKVDGKVGEQTVSAYIPYKKGASKEVEEEITVNDDGGEKDIPEEVPVEEPTTGLKLRKDVLLPYQLLGPLAELNSKYPQPNKVAAATTGRIKLPRVNFNSERAASSASSNAANKFIQNQAAGPGAIAVMMATNEKQRSGNMQIANEEARNNKQLAAQEEMGNLQASQFDAQNVTRARQFNAVTQNQRDQNEYEKRMLAFNQLGTNTAQYANDVRAYKAEERFAEASQIGGEYTRQKYLEELRKQYKRKNSNYFGMNDTQLREQAARMSQGAPTYAAQDREKVEAVANAMTQAQQQTTQSKRGGYLGKIGKIKRKRK